MIATIQFRKFCFPVTSLKTYVQNYNVTWFLCGCETWSLTLRKSMDWG